MILILHKHATKDEIKKMAKDFEGFIKVVVDIEKNIVAGGGERHFDAEQMLLTEGSNQSDLWGGGLDLETREIDYNSMINLRPSQENPSRDILSKEIRKKLDNLVEEFFL